MQRAEVCPSNAREQHLSRVGDGEEEHTGFLYANATRRRNLYTLFWENTLRSLTRGANKARNHTLIETSSVQLRKYRIQTFGLVAKRR